MLFKLNKFKRIINYPIKIHIQSLYHYLSLIEKLNLPENRVAIRGIDAIRSLTIANHITQGPELVTPIGIAIAAHHSPVQYKTVYVNEPAINLRLSSW